MTSVERLALFGDVQGHVDVYTEALERLGVDIERGRVPKDLKVIQVGDLIHKGPASDEVIRLADRLLRTSPERYVQLAGNHDGQYLGGPLFWANTIGDDAARTLASWFVDGAIAIAHAFETTEFGAVLASHGGMSLERWAHFGKPEDPVVASRLLNEEFWNDPASALKPGIMLMGEPGPPGVAWTEPVRELYLPWAEAEWMPFSQVHGHRSAYSWRNGKWFRDVPRRLRKVMVADTEARHTRMTVGTQTFVGIDTAYGARPEAPLVPLILHSP